VQRVGDAAGDGLEARVGHAGPTREERAAHGERVRAEDGRVSVCGRGVRRAVRDANEHPKEGMRGRDAGETHLGRGSCLLGEGTTGKAWPDDDDERELPDHSRIV
jgi:hypothetical protein